MKHAYICTCTECVLEKEATKNHDHYLELDSMNCLICGMVKTGNSDD